MALNDDGADAFLDHGKLVVENAKVLIQRMNPTEWWVALEDPAERKACTIRLRLNNAGDEIVASLEVESLLL
jgi:hypothetical protein